MNLLLITFSFPPAGGVGVLRALSLAKYLPENGIRVADGILTQIVQPGPLRLDPPGITLELGSA